MDRGFLEMATMSLQIRGGCSMINEKLCNQDTSSGEKDSTSYREAKCLERCGSPQGQGPRNLSGTKEL